MGLKSSTENGKGQRKKAKIRKNNRKRWNEKMKFKGRKDNRMRKGRKKPINEVKKRTSPLPVSLDSWKGSRTPNSQRWISKIISTEHKFADCGSVESPWTSSALLNITRNLSIITEGLLSTRPNCSNNFNYFPWQILCFMYFSGLIIMISLISRYRA